MPRCGANADSNLVAPGLLIRCNIRKARSAIVHDWCDVCTGFVVTAASLSKKYLLLLDIVFPKATRRDAILYANVCRPHRCQIHQRKIQNSTQHESREMNDKMNVHFLLILKHIIIEFVVILILGWVLQWHLKRNIKWPDNNAYRNGARSQGQFWHN